ncbi:MAG: hypothetical protein ACREU4_07960, partial [Burkholderiales bacterium]
MIVVIACVSYGTAAVAKHGEVALPCVGMPKVIPETPPDYDRTRVIERPDGVYWQDKESGREYGPFTTLLEAVQDMEIGSDRNL